VPESLWRMLHIATSFFWLYLMFRYSSLFLIFGASVYCPGLVIWRDPRGNE